MEKKKAYLDKFNARISELQADINKLDAKARQSEADMKIKYQKEIEELEEKKAQLQKRLDEIKNSSEDAWYKFKDGAEKAFEDLRQSWKAAMDKFK